MNKQPIIRIENARATWSHPIEKNRNPSCLLHTVTGDISKLDEEAYALLLNSPNSEAPIWLTFSGIRVLARTSRVEVTVDVDAPIDEHSADALLVIVEYHLYKSVCVRSHLSLTPTQKLQALALRFYQGLAWNPQEGDYYTTSRADLELYQVALVEDGTVYTRYCNQASVAQLAKWPVEEFTTQGFGIHRVWVPPYVLETM